MLMHLNTLNLVYKSIANIVGGAYNKVHPKNRKLLHLKRCKCIFLSNGNNIDSSSLKAHWKLNNRTDEWVDQWMD